jgi:hypothetical protein
MIDINEAHKSHNRSVGLVKDMVCGCKYGFDGCISDDGGYPVHKGLDIHVPHNEECTLRD